MLCWNKNLRKLNISKGKFMDILIYFNGCNVYIVCFSMYNMDINFVDKEVLFFIFIV